MTDAGHTLAKLIGFGLYMAGMGCWAFLFHTAFGG